MSEIVIVDTDVVSFLIKGDTRALAYRQHLQDKTLAISFLRHSCPLVTHNRQDFSGISGLTIVSEA